MLPSSLYGSCCPRMSAHHQIQVISADCNITGRQLTVDAMHPKETCKYIGEKL